MRKSKNATSRQRQSLPYNSLDTSAESLHYGKPMYMVPQFNHTEEGIHHSRSQTRQTKIDSLDRLSKEDFQPALYDKAVQYRNSHSYKTKNSTGEYEQLTLFQDTEKLKYFGLGTYFYIQFFRRLVWLLFFMTIVQAITIFLNYRGDGLKNYESTFSTYLIKSTLGNYDRNIISSFDGSILAIVPAVNFLAVFIFYLIWKAHFFKCISKQESDNQDIKPEKYCLEIEGLDQNYSNQDQLRRLFSNFGPIFQVSMVRRHKNKLQYFQDLNELEEKIKEEELQVILGSGDQQNIDKLKREKDSILKQIEKLQIQPKTVSAFIHFQFQKSKIDCLTYYNEHYLFSTCGHSCFRGICCCCLKQPQQKYILKDNNLMIKNGKIPSPEDINWESIQLSSGSTCMRIFFSFLIIIIFLALSCTIIGLCSIYISSHSSNCQGLTYPDDPLLVAATSNSAIIQCYCSSHLIQSFSDSNIQTTCSNYLTGIYIEQIIQYAVIITASITNWIFGFIVDKLVNCIRPASKSSGLYNKTVIYTIFIVINSICIPVLIYADIFGFKASSYVSFVTMISSDINSFLSISNISFYPDFTAVWYRNVSPIFTNFLIMNTLLVWLFFIIDKISSSKQTLTGKQGKILQKRMNQQITDFKLNAYKQKANLYLVLILVCLFYTGIPILLPIGFINILSRYIVNRSLLQNNSARIQGLGEQFSSLSFSVFSFILIFFPIIGEWMLVANTNVLTTCFNMTLPILNNIFPELNKELIFPFFIIISVIALFEFFLYNTLIRCCSWMCSLCYQKKQVIMNNSTRPFSDSSKSINILYSYNIRNNQKMRKAILNLDKYLLIIPSDK